MKLSTIFQHLPRRLAVVGTLAAVAAGLVVPATALAAPAKTCDLSCVIGVGDTQITNRLNALNTLSGKVTTHQNAGRLTSAQAASLQNDITTNESGLMALKAKLDAAPDVTTARQDVRSIYTDFRIYVVVLPRDYRIMWLDILSNVDAKLRSLQPKIEAAIDKAPASEQAQLNQLYSDYKAQLAEAEAQIDAAQGQIATLTVANFNNARTVFETAKLDMTTDLKTAHRDIHQAASDLHQMVTILRANSSGGSSTSPTPTATVTGG
jgi:multidrug resistance efflux pump